MLLYNGQKPFVAPKYSIESYEPVDLKPEEQKQNDNYIKMAFTGQRYTNYNTPNMKVNKTFIKSYTDNRINTGYNQVNTFPFQFGNKNLIQMFNSSSANLYPNQNVKAQKIIVPVMNYNTKPQINYPDQNYIQNNIRCKSSKNLDPHRQQIIISNNNLINNNIVIPTNHRMQLSPQRITKRITYSNKNVIPIYHKIVYRRKGVV